jgi:hypothetical protein
MSSAMSEPNWLTDEVFIVEDLLSPQECEEYIELSESMGYEDALVTSPYGQILRPDIRNNDRVIYDDPELAEAFWQRIERTVWRKAAIRTDHLYFSEVITAKKPEFFCNDTENIRDYLGE